MHDSSPPSGRFPRLRGTLRAAEVDRTVFYAVLARGWQFAAGTVTNLLIAFAFSADLQGFYYTFASLLAMQTIAELGLHWIIVHAASHEWAHLTAAPDGHISGDEQALSRLANLSAAARKWFVAVASIFTVVVLVVGTVFFSQRPAVVPWFAPWFCSCLLCGLSLAISPSIAVLEGCNQMAIVNWYRLIQFVVGSLCVWAFMLMGFGLWVVAVGFAVRLGSEVQLVYGRFNGFWRSLRKSRGDDTVNWRTEIWPLQWRAATQAPAHYLAFQMFTPLMFHYHGPVVAGTMGMTWTVLNVIQQGALVWVQSRAPQFGMLIAQRNPRELKRLFMRVALISAGVLMTGITVFLVALYSLNVIDHPITLHLSQRLLTPSTAALFAAGVFFGHIPQCLNIYLKAHKQAPLFWLFFIANLITAAAVFLCGSRWGPVGAGLAMLAVTLLIRLPGSLVISRRFQRRFRQDG